MGINNRYTEGNVAHGDSGQNMVDILALMENYKPVSYNVSTNEKTLGHGRDID